MTKQITLFLVTFVIGAGIALAVRTALYKPVSGPVATPETPAYAAMADNSTAPAKDKPVPTKPENPENHNGHSTAPTPPSAGKTVNTVCPICGMDVDLAIQPATYQGQAVGFGCKACPPKFSANPDRYGPHALRDEVAPK